MSETDQPITECPVCRYNLTGLPKNHRCPECGFEYDETMRVWWTARRGPSDIFKWVGVEGFVAIPILGLIGVYGQLWWAIGLFLLGLALVTAFLIRPRRTWFVILSDSARSP